MRGVIFALAACLLANHAQARGDFHRFAAAATQGEARHVAAAARDIVAEAVRHLGQGNFTGRPGAWCAWFVSAVLRATGHAPLPSGMAASALAYGPRDANPRPGDIAVMPHHVGFVVEADGARVRIVSGNWGRRVALATLPRGAFVAFVRI